MKATALFVVATTALVAAGSPWPQSARDRADKIVASLTLEQKLGMVHGWSEGTNPHYVGFVPATGPVPEMRLEDGPEGVADGVQNVTAWPAALTVAASWDRDLVYQYGRAMAEEQYTKGSNVMLGPMVNLARVPVGGRVFECTGGEGAWTLPVRKVCSCRCAH